MKSPSLASLKQRLNNKVGYCTGVIAHAKRPQLLQMFEMIPFGWLP